MNVDATGDPITEFLRAALRAPGGTDTLPDVRQRLIECAITDAWHGTPVDPETGLHDLASLEEADDHGLGGLLTAHGSREDDAAQDGSGVDGDAGWDDPADQPLGHEHDGDLHAPTDF